MQGLFLTLSTKEPKWTLEKSLIGINPGLGFRPISSKTEEGSLIWYNITNHTTIEKWVKLADTFLKPYKENQTGRNFVPCNFDKLPGPNKVCIAPISDLGPCNPDESYGYNSTSPCVFLKLNRINRNNKIIAHKILPSMLKPGVQCFPRVGVSGRMQSNNNSVFKCCKKASTYSTCIKCSGIFHRTCLNRAKKNYKFLANNHVICCAEEQAQEATEEISTLEITIQDLTEDTVLKSKHIQKLKSENDKFAQEAIKVETELNDIIDQQKKYIEELVIQIQELQKKRVKKSMQ
ncbi:hypothetical protein JTB14_020311 [Gonioctena quinquepunctata]|nr:hypothetical protein JTB14_020311 [Gonioctena quinquepunctata]